MQGKQIIEILEISSPPYFDLDINIKLCQTEREENVILLDC